MQVAGFLLLPVYTHFLSPAEYGIIEIIERVVGIINICLMAGGIRQATLTFYLQSNNINDRDQIAPTITGFILLIFMLSCVIILFISPPLASWMSISNPRLLVFGVVAMISDLFLVVPLTLMQARIESITFVLVNMLILVFRVLLAVLFVVYLKLGVWGAFGALFISFISFGIILTTRELCHASFRINFKKFREIVRFSFPFIPTGIFFFLIFSGDRFFLLKASGQDALGIYGLACKLASISGTIAFQPLFKVWTAKMYERFEMPNADVYVGQLLTKIMIVYAFVSMGLSVFHREILTILSTPLYYDAGKIIAPLVLANGFLFISNYMECVFYVFRRTDLKPLTAFLGALVILLLYSILIPHYKILGAVYSTLFGYAFMALITLIVSRRLFKIQYEISKLLMLLIITFIVVLVSNQFRIGFYYFLLKCILIFLWLTGVWFFGILKREDKSFLISFFKANFIKLSKKY